MTSDKDDICGISKWWALPQDSIFTPACVVHDLEYVKKEEGQQHKTRKEVDREFLERALTLAGDNKLSRIKAYLLYAVIRAFGGFVW